MKFFSLLKKKIAVDTDRNFDRRFWNRFDAEFANQKPGSNPMHVFWKKVSLRFALTALAAVSVVVTIMLSEHQKRELELDILKHEQIVDHLDLFMHYDAISQMADEGTDDNET